MANNPVFVHLLVFLLLQGMDVLCPEVTVETCSTPCAMTTQTGCQPVPPDLACCPRHPYPFYPPFPFFPPPAAPSYCVQSVVVGGRDECEKKNKTAVMVKKPEVKPAAPRPAHHYPQISPGHHYPQCCPGHHYPQICPGHHHYPTYPPAHHHPRPLPAPIPPTPGPLHHRACSLSGARHSITKYQEYIEKMLDLLNDKTEPNCDPPLMVVAPKKRKTKRKKKRKYCLASMEDNSPIYVIKAPRIEEEDDHEPAIIIKHRRNKCCLCRPCLKTCCKTVLANESDDDE